MSEAIQVTEASPRVALIAAEVDDIAKRRDPIVERAHALVVASQATMEAAVAFLTSEINPLLKEIDKSCDPVCAAANAVHVAATTQRATLKAPLLEAKEVANAKIKAHLEEQDRIAAIEAAQIEERRNEAAERGEVLPSPPPVTSAPRPVKGMATGKAWCAEVVDFGALVLAVASGDAPSSLLKVDESKLRKLVRALDGQVQYAGVRVYQERTLATKAKA